jgi:hypothetical protein
VNKPAAFPASGLALVGSSVQTVYLMLPESGSCQTDAAKPSASKPASPKLLQETRCGKIWRNRKLTGPTPPNQPKLNPKESTVTAKPK